MRSSGIQNTKNVWELPIGVNVGDLWKMGKGGRTMKEAPMALVNNLEEVAKGWVEVVEREVLQLEQEARRSKRQAPIREVLVMVDPLHRETITRVIERNGLVEDAEAFRQAGIAFQHAWYGGSPGDIWGNLPIRTCYCCKDGERFLVRELKFAYAINVQM